MDKYFDEMPEEIANLAKKYKNVSFNTNLGNSLAFTAETWVQFLVGELRSLEPRGGAK